MIYYGYTTYYGDSVIFCIIRSCASEQSMSINKNLFMRHRSDIELLLPL